VDDQQLALSQMGRRRFLAGSVVGASALVLASCTSDGSPALPGMTGSPDTIPQPAAASTLGDGSSRFALFSQEDLNFMALYALGGAGVTGETGEVVAAVDQANSPSGGATYQSFYDAFIAMANLLKTEADEALAAGHRVTARSRYLRSSSYYDQALFFVLATSTPDAEESVYLAQEGAWSAAAALAEPRWEQVEIPYEGSFLPGWFLSTPLATGPRPTVIINNGSDGQNVDLWAFGGAAALERGWNALIFEGPGQGSMLFVRQEPFRPDWEAVITPIVDYLETRRDVDPRRIALTGWSQGGELVARAAAFEHRLAAVVTDPGSVDIYEAFPEDLRQIAEGAEAEVNTTWNEVIAPGASPAQQFTLKKRLEIYSAEALEQARAGKVPTDWYGLSRTIAQFQIRDVAAQITSPVLIVDYEDEAFYPGQAKELEGLLSAPHTYVELTAETGSQYHCAPMAPQRRNEVVFDWLAETLDQR
jgi:hypothetical protein